MSKLTDEEIKEINELYRLLITNSPRCKEDEEKALVDKAFRMAFDAHKDMRRRSGEPYILHPLSVARIVSEDIGLGVKSIISSLLHDVVEDTEITLEEIEHAFGPKIAYIIDGLTKTKEIEKNSIIPDLIGEVSEDVRSKQLDNFKKMLLTLSDDVRVIFIKLADRLHNMRTLSSMPRDKQLKIASETIYLYAPLAHRLGLYSIKTELEDLSLRYRNPEIYHDLQLKREDSVKQQDEYIKNFIDPITKKLKDNHIEFEISSRFKSVYSIWNKIQNKKVSFDQIYDIFAIRIIFDPSTDISEKTQCWNIYSIISDLYMPMPERLRDHITTPKSNGYEALHITVMGPQGRWIEVQIRTKRMDEIAEKGLASHFKYKNDNQQESELDKWLRDIREMLKNPDANALEFIEEFKLNLFSSEIQVFDRGGKLVTLPKGSTVLDFAYYIHSKNGNTAMGAKVNHKLVPINHVLSSGDHVEIINSDKNRVQREWLDFVVTARAKSAIKNVMKAENRNRLEKGKKMLESAFKQWGQSLNSKSLRTILEDFRMSNKEELYSKIGSEIILLDDINKVFKKESSNKWMKYWKLTIGRATGISLGSTDKPQPPVKKSAKFSKDNPFILTENIEDNTRSYIIAPCCNPLPGEEVIGFLNVRNEVIIHKSKCPNAVKLLASQSNKIVPTRWTTHKILSFPGKIHIKGIDRLGIYNDIISTISKDLNINIRSINLSSNNGIFEGEIELYVHSINDINKLTVSINKIKGVDFVKRVENIEQ